ncbi:DUF835 domain-containing protein [Thermococcus sp.]
MIEYGDLFKLMGILVGIPFVIYAVYVALKERSRALLMHSFGWFLFLAALAPDEPYFFQKIFLGFSGVCMAIGVSSLVYTRKPKGLTYLAGLPLMLFLNPLYEILGKAFFSGESLKRFMNVIHTAQYGYVLILLGVMIQFSSREKDFRRFGLFYSSMGATLILYPFAKGAGLEFRALDISLGFLIGIFLMIYVSRLIRSRIELIIPEKTANKKGLKRVSIVNKKKAREILAKFESFPVLAFVREYKYPEQWNVYIITNAPMEKAISPTNLALISELCVRYMREAMEKGSSGVIYINCLEYLRIYNSFNSLLKLLHALRDYAIIYDGTVIIEIEEESWDEKERVLLKEIEI